MNITNVMLIRKKLFPSNFKCKVCNGPFHPLILFFRSIELPDHISIKILIYGKSFPGCQCDHCYSNELKNELCCVCHNKFTCIRCGIYFKNKDIEPTLCAKCEEILNIDYKKLLSFYY